MEPKTKNIHQKILEVMAATGHVDKNGRNDFHRYDYAMESDILDAVRPELIKAGLVIYADTIADERERYADKDGKATNERNLMVEYKIVNADNPEEVVIVHFPGVGHDAGDKAVYKALTGSEKYFLMKTLLISTGDDPEKDAAPAKARKAPTKATTGKSAGGAKATPKQIGFIRNLAEELKLAPSEIAEMKRQQKVEHIDDLTPAAASDLITELKAMADEYYANGTRPTAYTPKADPETGEITEEHIDLGSYSAAEVADMFGGEEV
jgi:hypothetical protein